MRKLVAGTCSGPGCKIEGCTSDHTEYGDRTTADSDGSVAIDAVQETYAGLPADTSLDQYIVDWFKQHPNPEDISVHELAYSLGIEPAKLEKRVYSMFTKFLSTMTTAKLVEIVSNVDLRMSVTSGWFEDLDPKAQKKYIAEHPTSKYARQAKSAKPAPAKTGTATKAPAKAERRKYHPKVAKTIDSLYDSYKGKLSDDQVGKRLNLIEDHLDDLVKSGRLDESKIAGQAKSLLALSESDPVKFKATLKQAAGQAPKKTGAQPKAGNAPAKKAADVPESDSKPAQKPTKRASLMKHLPPAVVKVLDSTQPGKDKHDAVGKWVAEDKDLSKKLNELWKKKDEVGPDQGRYSKAENEKRGKDADKIWDSALDAVEKKLFGKRLSDDEYKAWGTGTKRESFLHSQLIKIMQVIAPKKKPSF